jgi:hypothetical protein
LLFSIQEEVESLREQLNQKVFYEREGQVEILRKCDPVTFISSRQNIKISGISSFKDVNKEVEIKCESLLFKIKFLKKQQ